MADGILGIDIGGSGIKGNLVDPHTGRVTAERYKILTPDPSTPDAVAKVVAAVVGHFEYTGPVGCTFPAIVRRGVTLSAANVDKRWIGTDAEGLFEQTAGNDFTVINDADAAGVAEVAFGAAKGRGGVVLVLTLGTGIGSALIVDGTLVPNTELGHLHFAGHDSVEDWASARAKEDEDLSFKQWARRLDSLLGHLNRLFSPDLFVLGGGVSRRWDRFAEYLTGEVETVPASLGNEAGIVGAAMAAVGAHPEAVRAVRS
jgi:polyphosphate glucokinase